MLHHGCNIESGVYRLMSPCAASARITANDIESAQRRSRVRFSAAALTQDLCYSDCLATTTGNRDIATHTGNLLRAVWLLANNMVF